MSPLGLQSESMTYPINVLPRTTLATPAQNPSYLMFDGISTVLTVPNFVDVMLLDSFTVEMWIQCRPTSFSGVRVQYPGLGWAGLDAYIFSGLGLITFSKKV